MKIPRAFLVISVLFIARQVSADLNSVTRQSTSCSTDGDCIDGFFFPVLRCVNGLCIDPTAAAPAAPLLAMAIPAPGVPAGGLGAPCTSIRSCASGLICVSQNPGGRCAKADGALGLAHFMVNLIQEDYTPSTGTEPLPDQGGATRTSRALAIIFLAAHDAFGIISGAFAPKITSRSVQTESRRTLASSSSPNMNRERQAEAAMQAAAFTAAKLLYPSLEQIVDPVLKNVTDGAIEAFVRFGEVVGRTWFRIRLGDGSQRDQLDDIFAIGEFLRHQPDPNFPLVTNIEEGVQRNFGRFWGRVRPFQLSNVRREAFLGPFPKFESDEYRANLEEVTIKGQCNDLTLPNGVRLEDIGIFWGYDGALGIGVPPRLYLQVVLALRELQGLSLREQIRALTAVNVAMADAGIAAWFWKFFYDLWRPTIGVRNDTISAMPEWNPRGVPLSNIVTTPKPPFCVGLNPNFPAYPSGHASFGTAAFATIAKMLSKRPRDLAVAITSDEFNGRTIEGTTGLVRREFTQRISLQEAIEQNKDSRVFLGVHWRFDSEGGDVVGQQVADIVARAFSV
ncbi:Vanadium chloroperoxidase [Gracilariopsis chorda]|uniref:Vanadium chloroperoxidase n=1 Tax=Gracilariopsis chorda TaxID=448386 RepID=A0A2V3IL39_9FLOR|nr:Vanadium chloroperoxidase [Gracilariopsis chorda]|eukprot:PXF42802.1 Vanadium chloroperoxidase [Gracilariopsis chorda]